MHDDEQIERGAEPTRLWIVVPAALWIFGLLAWLMNLDERPLPYALRVVGAPAHAGPGPLALRVIASEPRTSRAHRVYLRACDAGPAACATHDGAPGRLVVTPGDAGDDEVLPIRFDVLVAQERRPMQVEVPLTPIEAPRIRREAQTLQGVAPAWRVESEALIAELWPADGWFAAGLPQDVWVRVQDRAGAPLAAAEVDLAGALARTDGDGLAELTITLPPMKGAAQIRVQPLDPALAPAQEQVRYPPATRAYTLAPGGLLTPETRTLAVRRAGWVAPLDCHVTRLGQHTGDARGGPEDVSLPSLPPGIHALSCSDDPAALAERAVTRLLLVPPGDADAALADLLAGRAVHASPAEAPWFAALTARLGAMRPDERARLARYLLALSRAPSGELEVLAATLEGDLRARAETTQGKRAWVIGLLGVSFTLLLAWALWQVLANARRLRAQARALVAEEGFEDEVAGLTRQGLGLTFVVLLGIILANIVGLIWLLDLVSRVITPRF